MKTAVIPSQLTRPVYSFTEADYLAGATRGTARRWIKGYAYTRKNKRTEQPPVTPRDANIAAASFLDLLEVVVIGRFKETGISLSGVRQIVSECQEILGLERPLVQAKFQTDGREVFVDQGKALLGLGSRKRQEAWSEVLAPFLDELDFAQEGWASRWWPLGKATPILIDPDFGFGQPVIEGSGVKTETIIERVRAGDLPEEIAEDFNVKLIEVHRAIQYEASRIAA